MRKISLFAFGLCKSWWGYVNGDALERCFITFTRNYFTFVGVGIFLGLLTFRREQLLITVHECARGRMPCNERPLASLLKIIVSKNVFYRGQVEISKRKNECSLFGYANIRYFPNCEYANIRMLVF